MLLGLVRASMKTCIEWQCFYVLPLQGKPLFVSWLPVAVVVKLKEMYVDSTSTWDMQTLSLETLRQEDFALWTNNKMSK